MRWLLCLLLLIATLQGKQLEVSVHGEGVVLINGKTGAVLFEKDAHTPLFPASTTKTATALYALHMLGDNLDKTMTASREATASITPQAKRQSNYRSPPHWLETDGCHIGIKNGEEFRFYDLLHAVLIGSANDASNVVAENVGKTIPLFMEGVNAYLKEIGCQNTHFTNPHGLHQPDHQTTAYDLALVAKEALKHPFFREIVRKARYECPQTNLEYERTFIQTNRLVKNGTFSYPKAIGVKTGTTQAAGKNLVAAAEDDRRFLIAVALGYRGDAGELYRDVTRLFEAAFKEPKMRRTLLKGGMTNLTTKVEGARKSLKTKLLQPLYYDFYPSEECAVKAKVKWELPPLPIEAGVRVGSVEVVDAQGELLQRGELCALEGLKPTLWHQLSHVFGEEGKGRKWLFLGGVGCILLFFWRLRKKRTSRRSLF